MTIDFLVSPFEKLCKVEKMKHPQIISVDIIPDSSAEEDDVDSSDLSFDDEEFDYVYRNNTPKNLCLVTEGAQPVRIGDIIEWTGNIAKVIGHSGNIIDEVPRINDNTAVNPQNLIKKIPIIDETTPVITLFSPSPSVPRPDNDGLIRINNPAQSSQTEVNNNTKNFTKQKIREGILRICQNI